MVALVEKLDQGVLKIGTYDRQYDDIIEEIDGNKPIGSTNRYHFDFNYTEYRLLLQKAKFTELEPNEEAVIQRYRDLHYTEEERNVIFTRRKNKTQCIQCTKRGPSRDYTCRPCYLFISSTGDCIETVPFAICV